MKAKPKSIDEYLSQVSDEQRVALERLRKMIHAAAPKAEEYIGYGLAAFRLHGKPLVAFGATDNHCGFYLMSGSMVEAHQDILAKYDTSKGTIRFMANKPLPATIVTKLVKARIAENESLKRKPSVKPAQVDKPKVRQTDPAVVAFIDELDHPRKPEIVAIRKLILGISPEICEGIKWNSPSFRTSDYFATVNVLGKEAVRLILHTGAKTKEFAKTGLKIEDPQGLLKWLAKDRAMVVIADPADWKAKRKALEGVLREWVAHLL